MNKHLLKQPLVYLFFLSVIPVALNAQKPGYKKIFLIDSVLYTTTSELLYAVIFEEEIADKKVIASRQQLQSLGYPDTDTLVTITTKAYLNRPDSAKAIPNQLELLAKKGAFYQDTSQAPYTGPFINYYINGKKEVSGFIKNGHLDGPATLFYQNGHVREFRYYHEGRQDSTREEYFTDGILKLKGKYRNGLKTGEWQAWYSDGSFKYDLEYMDNEAILGSTEFDFFKLFNLGLEELNNKKYNAAIRQFNQANELKNDYDELFLYRGLCYRMLKKYDKALNDFNGALAIEPAETDARIQKVYAGLSVLEDYKKNNYRQQTIDDLNKEICKDVKKLLEQDFYSLEFAHLTANSCLEKKPLIIDPY